MIIDTLDNLEKYIGVNPLIGEVLEFVRAHDLKDLAVGHYVLKGDEVFLNIDMSEGKTRSDAFLEFHHKMMDIQIPFDEEEYGWSPIEEVPHEDYDAARDIGFAPTIKPQQYVRCKPGMFVVFAPQDVHAPLITEAREIKKAIFKIKV
ncbi:YhcH/YjgK/YiaL family protein [Prevotella sp. KH2C16]|uniref:YhcH/YjgK/YiaL family protein n=1 Tax=Prevotella sp. KH2C16 TaxID=1855325 RepID=UPI0008EA7BB2|nr:YhcH/YjgK/YiaL family protein [Prevotella sp. KH2C16]SFF93677.1 YhcH/YjgK/YiaL family protein [Prevotella sp. KH2C16]